jgi:hypothetical protein
MTPLEVFALILRVKRGESVDLGTHASPIFKVGNDVYEFNNDRYMPLVFVNYCKWVNLFDPTEMNFKYASIYGFRAITSNTNSD